MDPYLTASFSGWSLEELQQHRADLMAAIKAITKGKSYTIDNRQLTRMAYQIVQEAIAKVNAEILNLTQEGNGVVPNRTRCTYPDFSGA